MAPNAASAAPLVDTADPTIRFIIDIDYQHRYVVPQRLAGQVKTEKGVVIGDLTLPAIGENALKVPVLPRSNQNEPIQQWKVQADLRLTSRALERILDAREANRKKDVNLDLNLLFFKFQPSFRVTNLPNIGAGEGVVSAEQTFMGPGLGSFETEVINLRVGIRSSDWTADYAPVFGVGRFIVIELPDLTTHVDAKHPLAPDLVRAAEAVGKMAEAVRTTEWTDCVKESRPVAELLKNKRTDLKALLEGDGYSGEAADLLLQTLQPAFDFASKFIHATGKPASGPAPLNPPMTAKKEDALFVYSVATTLVNLVAHKMARAP